MQRLVDGQGEFDLGLGVAAAGGPLEITASQAAHLWGALGHVYDLLGLGKAAGGDEVFRQLVLARIIEPTSKQDSLRVLEETGVPAVSYPMVNRRLPGFAKAAFRQALSAACADHAALGLAALVLYDVSTLYFEADAGDGFREPGFSKERVPGTARSPSGCSPTPRGSRCRWPRSRATGPRLYFEADAGDGFREPGFSKERVPGTARSPSGCSPTPRGSRCRWPRSRATGPRPPPCSPSYGSSWPHTGCGM